MATAYETLRPGAKVQVHLRRNLVCLKPGSPGQIWALSSGGGIGITTQDDGSVRVDRSGSVNASGKGSVASGGNIGIISTGDSGFTNGPEADQDHEYTIHLPVDTIVEFLDRDGMTVVETATVQSD